MVTPLNVWAYFFSKMSHLSKRPGLLFFKNIIFRHTSLLWSALGLGCSELLWVALGWLLAALGCSGLLWAALGCFGVLWAALC